MWTRDHDAQQPASDWRSRSLGGLGAAVAAHGVAVFGLGAYAYICMHAQWTNGASSGRRRRAACSRGPAHQA